MKIKQLHTIVEDALYAIEWEGEGTDCFDLFLQKMTNVEFLRKYFKYHQSKLRYFKQVRNIDDAVINTIEEIGYIEDALIEHAECGKEFQSIEHLSLLFEPLDDRIGILEFGLSKLKGHDYFSPWIRLYAIKVSKNKYVITGGGIKLVEKMQDDPFLTKELDKLRIAKQYFFEEED